MENKQAFKHNNFTNMIIHNSRDNSITKTSAEIFV